MAAKRAFGFPRNACIELLNSHDILFLDFCFYLCVAASEHGLKIMAMLYLTPVLPLGLVSYMCGTTSMDIVSFAVAKIASLPLYLIYTFMGASAHSFIKRGKKGADDAGGEGVGDEQQQPEAFSAAEEAKQLEENEALVVAGIVLSIFMMTCITRYIKKELMKVGRLLSGANSFV